VRRNDTAACLIRKEGGHQILEDAEKIESVFPAAIEASKYRRSAQKPRSKSTGSGELWHLRMGPPSLLQNHLQKSI
jgi:hypothetical protein